MLLEDAPAFGWAKQYQLPEGCLRVFEVQSYDHDVSWTIEGDRLLSNHPGIKIKYVQIVTQTGLYSPEFVTALAARLAAELCLPLLDSQTRFDMLYKLYQARVSKAALDDARSQNVWQHEPKDSWLKHRGPWYDWHEGRRIEMLENEFE